MFRWVQPYWYWGVICCCTTDRHNPKSSTAEGEMAIIGEVFALLSSVPHHCISLTLCIGLQYCLTFKCIDNVAVACITVTLWDCFHRFIILKQNSFSLLGKKLRHFGTSYQLHFYEDYPILHSSYCRFFHHSFDCDWHFRLLIATITTIDWWNKYFQQIYLATYFLHNQKNK